MQILLKKNPSGTPRGCTLFQWRGLSKMFTCPKYATLKEDEMQTGEVIWLVHPVDPLIFHKVNTAYVKLVKM